MAILLFGATGMVGQAITAEAGRRGRQIVGVSRHGPDRAVDLATAESLRDLVAATRPELVVNAAAMIGLEACERDPALAYAVNARAVALMSDACEDAGVRLVHVSTDHYFTGDGDRAHAETDPVTLVNVYARTKHAGETFAALAPEALVLRTNVTGLRGWPGKPTFAEWALDVVARHAPMRLYDDFYTSTIDAESFASALFDLADAGATGLLNVAASSVASKRHFVHGLAHAMGVTLDWDEAASVRSLMPPRAESLGLDVGLAERTLGRALPGTAEVCRALAAIWNQQCDMRQAS